MSIAFNDFADVRATSQVPRRHRAGLADSRRPECGLAEYRLAPSAMSTAAHPLPRRAPRSGTGAAVTMCAALLTAFVVMALISLAHLRAGDPATVQGATSVVQVRGGETLSDVAARIAPDSPVGLVVARIIELNGMAGAGVYPGQTLIAPASTSR